MGNDRNKINLIKSKVYQVLVICDSEYSKYLKKTLRKCLDFLDN